MSESTSYSFSKDIASLHNNVDLLMKDHTPVATRRCCDRIRAILDRIQVNREQSYVPYDVKSYFDE